MQLILFVIALFLFSLLWDLYNPIKELVRLKIEEYVKLLQADGDKKLVTKIKELEKKIKELEKELKGQNTRAVKKSSRKSKR